MRISPIGNNYNANSIYGKIASGKRIQTAADDAAGLAIANKLKRHGNGLDVAANNISDGIGVANIQDGALGTIQDSLQRIRELSLKASNGIYGSDEKEMIQTEIDQLLQDIEGTAVGTQYNEKKLLDGSMADMYIASNPSAGEGMSIKMENATLKALGIEGYNVTGDFDIGAIDAAMEKVSAARSRTGASTNAMYHAYNYSKSASEEMVSSRSRIEDLDMGKAISRQKSEKLMKDYRMSMLRRKMQDDNSLVMRMFGNM
ncbi:flagellin [Parablautia intestinalis]|jgi:flagellin|uniref:Flagellin n=1 Tax=Parablautia intestinalis TaxID=2320100 RepID=A0A3A9AVK7_9FIRM|nr:flagellin [Parablautia intestinalis]MCI8614339.1 flagellin [Lachnospiraceae bacterium]RKI91286.1 flagellin [Parablautia intestinalis]